MSNFSMGSYVPVDGTEFTAVISSSGSIIPYEFTGWRDEVKSWNETAYLGAAISEMFPYTIKGPGATEFLKKYAVNNFDVAPVGKSKHIMLLNGLGNIASDGIILRIAEDEYLTSLLYPLIDFYMEEEHKAGRFLDTEGICQVGQFCLYQVGGPKSLEILETATQEDLHDIEYLHFRNATIAGETVRIFRLGMAGTLSYEVHCDAVNCEAVYKAILEAGEDFGIKRLGFHAYMMNHTENGFPQCGLHFYWDYREISGFIEWLERNVPWFIPMTTCPPNIGSYKDNIEAFYVSPYDIGWGYLINYDHDFVGKEAAWTKKNSKHRKVVTLEWNAEDIGDVYASQFAGGTPYMPMDSVNDYYAFSEYIAPQVADIVLDKNGKEIGISTGRGQIVHYNTMISLASIDPEYIEIGTEVVVIWGNENYPQKKIRAKVAKFPYLKLPKNEDFDVNEIPRRFPVKK